MGVSKAFLGLPRSPKTFKSLPWVFQGFLEASKGSYVSVVVSQKKRPLGSRARRPKAELVGNIATSVLSADTG